MNDIILFLKTHLLLIIYLSCLSIFGAVTGYIRKIKEGRVARFSLAEITGDIVISFFLGLITFLICKGMSLNEWLSAGFIGIAAHMGTRGLMMFDELIEAFLERVLNVKINEDKND